MKAQIPAEGIYKRHEWGDAINYGVTCECSDDSHSHDVWVEADDTGVNVTTYTQQKTKWWELNRFKIIWTLLTKGYIEYQATIIMTEQQALNYAETLKRAIIDVKQFKKERNEQNKSRRVIL
jgi:hypothetical protein